MLSELYYKSFHDSPVAKSVSTYDGTFIEINTSFLKLTGYFKEELIGKKSTDINLFPTYARQKMIDTLDNNIIIQNEEIEIQTKSNEIRYVLFSVESVIIGEKKCLLSVFIDITDRKFIEQEQKLAEKQLKESESKFKSIFDRSPIGIAMYDDDGHLKEINKA
jgi:PAS domain S-box-containing protein